MAQQEKVTNDSTHIVLNAAKCLCCGDTVISSTIHDFHKCSCRNISVDGGTHYLKRSAAFPEYMKDMSVSITDNASRMLIVSFIHINDTSPFVKETADFILAERPETKIAYAPLSCPENVTGYAHWMKDEAMSGTEIVFDGAPVMGLIPDRDICFAYGRVMCNFNAAAYGIEVNKSANTRMRAENRSLIRRFETLMPVHTISHERGMLETADVLLAKIRMSFDGFTPSV